MSVVENAKKLGAKFVMVAWIPHKDDFDIFEAQQAVEDFNQVGKILAENGITFAIIFMDMSLSRIKTEPFSTLLRDVPTPSMFLLN
jgi:sugar phosphate isomerase/epimerase